MQRLLYGGTFDPIHQGHVDVALSAGKILRAERVSLIPASLPPHKPGGAHASDQDRLEMVRRVAAEHELLDVIDDEIVRGEVSYTIDTVERLLAGRCNGDQLMLLLGADSLELLPSWHRVRELAELVPIAVARRKDSPTPDWPAITAAVGERATEQMKRLMLPTTLSAISSTIVRGRIADGKTSRCWVPDPVADYIEEKGLYKLSTEGDEPGSGPGLART